MLDQRFWSKVSIGKPEDCWVWTANRNNKGYGMFRPGGTAPKRLAHRLSFEDRNGAIPNGLCILHRCDNPSCVNPSHLFLGSQRDNMLDKLAKGRGNNPSMKGIGKPPIITGDDHWMRKHPERVRRGMAASNVKLTDEDIATIYRMRMDGSGTPAIAKALNMDKSTILDICNGERWSHRLGKDGNPSLVELKAVSVKPSYFKLKRTDIPTIRDMIARGMNNHQIADRYGVSHATISDIRRGLTWRDA